jgi:hypothetical protein
MFDWFVILKYRFIVYWTGLDWTGLDWTGLDRTGPDWTGLDRTEPKIILTNNNEQK